MRLVVQRVTEAKVDVNGETVGKINKGFMVLCGITHEDTEKEVNILARKLCNLRIFEDENDKMNLSLKDVGGELLIISQFTLYADSMSSGNRPSFIAAARPEKAKPLYEYFIKKCEEEGIHVEKGIFGADMKVSLLNDGPVTILLEK
ncbi:MAG TPA: D-tyrosyl-tRNA(Tyr) deacylase [Candidatus Scatovivens faecipullorum]|jgi:D-tyrosyl-tRNA(Tyr) deacylase|nr:D-tyrosyl-tRNA(Tyr) deacylase [Candidatus Scatovivens faecipullorum]